jgi:hypothetical protein
MKSVVNLSMVDTPPKSPIVCQSDFFSCSSDFHRLAVDDEPRPVRTRYGRGEAVFIINLAIKYEYGCDVKDYSITLSDGSIVTKTYNPMAIKAYRLFQVAPDATLFMCMENGEYAVVPGINHKKRREPVCIHTTDEEDMYCMACLTKFCKTCANDIVDNTCPCCSYEPYGCDSNTIFKKVLHSVIH